MHVKMTGFDSGMRYVMCCWSSGSINAHLDMSVIFNIYTFDPNQCSYESFFNVFLSSVSLTFAQCVPL